VKVDADVPFALLAPFGCGLQTGAGTAYNTLDVQAEQSFAVLGAGSVGLAALLAAVDRGCHTNIAVDRVAARLDLAQQLGATHTILAEGQDLAAALRAYREGMPEVWDALFALRTFLLGGMAIVSPVNLIHNKGFGPDATLTVSAEDLNALIPVATAPVAMAFGPSVIDDRFDRAALLFHLMSQWADPAMARRLAAGLRRGSALPLDAHVRLALAPFAEAAESLRLLEHLVAQGASSPHLDILTLTMRRAALTNADTP
jgi:hypothetical protein